MLANLANLFVNNYEILFPNRDPSFVMRLARTGFAFFLHYENSFDGLGVGGEDRQGCQV